MSRLTARLKRLEKSLGGNDVVHEDFVMYLSGDMTEDEFRKRYRPVERRAFIEREAAARGMTADELVGKVLSHWPDAEYPSEVWVNGKFQWSRQVAPGADPWAR